MEYNLDFSKRLIEAAKSFVENKSSENEASRAALFAAGFVG